MPINTPSPEYQKFLAQWTRCRDVFEGSDAVKAKGQAYLPPLEGHKSGVAGLDNAYTSYLSRALFYPAMGRTIMGLVGLMFSKPVTIVNIAEEQRAFLDDVTGDGVSFTGVAIDVTQEVLITGRCGALVDMPADVEGTPYWLLYKAEQIISYRVARVGSKLLTTQVVLEERVTVEDPEDPFQTKDVVRYRQLVLIDGVYNVVLWNKSALGTFLPDAPVVPLRRGQPLDYIPFAFFGPTTITPSVERSPLLDLADVNLSHYRTSADHEHGAHFTGLPTPYVTGHTLQENQTLGIGSGQAWVFPDPQARAGMVEFTGQGLGALRELKEEKRQMMVTLGARLLETQKNTQEAAETVRLRHAGESSSIALLSNAISQGLTQLLVDTLLWMGVATAERAKVEINPDLLDKMSSEDLKALVMTWQAGGISQKTLYHNMERGKLTRPNVNFEEESVDIENESPDDDLPDPIPELNEDE